MTIAGVARWLQADARDVVRVVPRSRPGAIAAAGLGESLTLWRARLGRRRLLPLARRQLLLALGAALLLELVRAWAGGGWAPWWLVAPALLALLGTGRGLRRAPPMAVAARMLDHDLRLSARSATALEVEQRTRLPGGLPDRVVVEAAAAVTESLGRARAVTRRAPMEWGLLVVAAALLAAVLVTGWRDRPHPAAAGPPAPSLLATAAGGPAGARTRPAHARPARVDLIAPRPAGGGASRLGRVRGLAPPPLTTTRGPAAAAGGAQTGRPGGAAAPGRAAAAGGATAAVAAARVPGPPAGPAGPAGAAGAGGRGLGSPGRALAAATGGDLRAVPQPRGGARTQAASGEGRGAPGGTPRTGGPLRGGHASAGARSGAARARRARRAGRAGAPRRGTAGAAGHRGAGAIGDRGGVRGLGAGHLPSQTRTGRGGIGRRGAGVRGADGGASTAGRAPGSTAPGRGRMPNLTVGRRHLAEQAGAAASRSRRAAAGVRAAAGPDPGLGPPRTVTVAAARGGDRPEPLPYIPATVNSVPAPEQRLLLGYFQPRPTLPIAGW